MIPSSLHEAARFYALLGWYIFPIAEDGKAPIPRNGFKAATTDLDQIDAWWSTYPNARIGCWCRASGFIVLDVDGERGREKLAELEAELGPLPRTFVQETGGKGGLHILLRDPHYDSSRDLSELISDVVGNIGGAGVIDVKANGYIVLSPSAAGKYRWLAFDPGKPVPTVPMVWRSRIVKMPSTAPIETPPQMSGDLAERVATGKAELREYVSRANTPMSRRIAEVLDGRGGEGCATGNARIGNVAYTIGVVSPTIGPEACIAIMRPTIAQIVGPEAHDQVRLGERALSSYLVGASEGAKKRHEDLAIKQIFDSSEPLRADGLAPVLELRPKAKRKAKTAAELVTEIYESDPLPQVPTPWAKFNFMAEGGLEQGTVTYLIGYQGSGKSSFAAQLGAFHAGSATGHTVYYLGEMTPRQLMGRVIGQLTQSAWRPAWRGEIPRSQAAIAAALKLYVLGRDPNPIEAIKQTIAEIREGDPTGPIMLVVDYIQLLAPIGNGDMRASNADIARQMLELTESQALVTVVLSQTSRSNSKRIRDGATDSVDLADTGAESSEFERSAAIQGVLSYQQKDDTRSHEVTMSIAKRRFGGPTKCYFEYDGLTGLWTEPDKPIVSKVEVDRETEIMAELESHAVRRCVGDTSNPQAGRIAPCCRPLMAAEFTKGPHKVSGQKQAIKNTLDRLVKENKVLKIGSVYALVGKVEPDA